MHADQGDQSEGHGGPVGHGHPWMGYGPNGPHGHGPGHHGMWRRRMMRPPAAAIFIFLFNCVFYMLAMVCFLGAINRAADAHKTMARLRALDKIPDAFTDDERAVLIHKVKARVLGLY